MGCDMNRDSFIYKFAKKLENPPESIIWKFFHVVWMLLILNIGRIAYKKIRNRAKTDTILYCNSVSSGDYFIFAAYLQEFIKANNIEKCSLIICQSQSRLCQELGFKVHTLDMIEFTAVVMYLHYKGGAYDNTIDFSPWLFLNKKKYFLNEPVYVNPLQKSKKYQNDLFENGLLKEKRTVILSPYEQTLKLNGYSVLPYSFWLELSKTLKEKGFCVCTNCMNNQEEPVIEDTLPVLPKYSEVCNFFETAGYYVGIRSGLSDIVSLSTLKKIILYPNKEAIDKWSLIGTFGTNNQIREISYELIGNDYSILIDKIFEELQCL